MLTQSPNLGRQYSTKVIQKVAGVPHGTLWTTIEKQTSVDSISELPRIVDLSENCSDFSTKKTNLQMIFSRYDKHWD